MVGDPDRHGGVDRDRAPSAPGWRGASVEPGRPKRAADGSSCQPRVVIVVISIAIAVSLFASLAGESQSFRDGYSAGGSAYTAYAAYSDTNITSEQACRDEETGPGGRPARDDPAQWIQGCVDAFNLAESDN